MREMDKEDSESLAAYTDKLRLADLWFGQADKLSSKGRSASAKAMFSRAERMYEAAYECLQELLDREPQLARLLDRHFEYGGEDSPALDPDSAPRLNTSRSRCAQTSHSHTERLELRIGAISSAYYALKYKA